MLRISNGQVYDPKNGMNGVRQDLYTEGGRFVPPSPGASETIDAEGCIIMPGGVEIHSHIAGAKVNSARIMCPEDKYEHFMAATGRTRSGVGHTVPTTFLTGYEYAGLGYTTVFEAAVPPLEARHAHEELKDTPLIDTGIYTLMGNSTMIMKTLQDKDKSKRTEDLRSLVAWMLTSSKGYAVKVVNPGGVEGWKWSTGAVDLDTPVQPFGISSRQILLALAETNEALKLPHGIHLHANHLGDPGNVQTTLETMKTLTGHRVHFTHLQFHSYGVTAKGGLKSAAPEVAEFMNAHPEFTCDSGQIVFGHATTMTADSPMQFHLHETTGNKWGSFDVEMETGSGIVPIQYRPSVLFNAIQWCIGLELLLLIKNPWQIVLTTDHPNAGPFTAYPQIIRLLMDADYRNSVIETLHPKVGNYTNLRDIKREYTLEEIAVITRSGPAKALGLSNKGHLGLGADADLVIYRPHQDKEKMFAHPAYVIKEGKVIVRDGVAQQSFSGKRLVALPYGLKGLADGSLTKELAQDFADYYSIALSNFAVQDEYLPRMEVVSCG